jgi:poly-gamma-glutamate biosynthesis protein PgsC/CapC
MIEFFKDPFVLSYAQYVYLAIGLGMLISLLFSETLGVMGGGVIVPGYFAMHLQDLVSVFMTFFIAYVAYLIIYYLSKYILIYGRRRVILSLLVAFLLGLIVRTNVNMPGSLDYIGFIIPGLVASWYDKQGVVRTTSVVLIQSSLVHFILMLAYMQYV